jgi:hypothetical protein
MSLAVLPDHGANRTGDPGARGVTRRARATSSKERANQAFARAPRPVIRLVRASGARRSESRRERIAARRSPVWRRTGEADATWHRLVPGEQRSESPTRVRGLAARRACPYVETVAEIGERRPRPREARYPLATGHVDGGPALAGSQKDPRGCKGVGSEQRGGQAAGLVKIGAGRPRGRCGAKILDRWKAPRIVFRFASFTRADRGGLGDLFESVRSASSTGSEQGATGVSEVRLSRAAAGRQRPQR